MASRLRIEPLDLCCPPCAVCDEPVTRNPYTEGGLYFHKDCRERAADEQEAAHPTEVIEPPCGRDTEEWFV
jgi:hypothetical protein